LTDQQLQQTNALNQQLLGQQESVGNLVVPQFQSILNNPGFSAADKAAISSPPSLRKPTDPARVLAGAPPPASQDRPYEKSKKRHK
jgi:hypothetical protein